MPVLCTSAALPPQRANVGHAGNKTLLRLPQAFIGVADRIPVKRVDGSRASSRLRAPTSSWGGAMLSNFSRSSSPNRWSMARTADWTNRYRYRLDTGMIQMHNPPLVVYHSRRTSRVNQNVAPTAALNRILSQPVCFAWHCPALILTLGVTHLHSIRCE